MSELYFPDPFSEPDISSRAEPGDIANVLDGFAKILMKIFKNDLHQHILSQNVVKCSF